MRIIKSLFSFFKKTKENSQQIRKIKEKLEDLEETVYSLKNEKSEERVIRQFLIYNDVDHILNLMAYYWGRKYNIEEIEEKLRRFARHMQPIFKIYGVECK